MLKLFTILTNVEYTLSRNIWIGRTKNTYSDYLKHDLLREMWKPDLESAPDMSKKINLDFSKILIVYYVTEWDNLSMLASSKIQYCFFMSGYSYLVTQACTQHFKTFYEHCSLSEK